MERRGLAVVIPALNEGATIGGIVSKARQFGAVIVVDDGSSDGTGEIARNAGAEVLRSALRQGYDRALESGLAHALASGHECFVIMDADGQHDPGLIGAFVRELQLGADLVIGIRDKQQRLAERAFAFAARWICGIQDPLCGMKGFQASLYQALGHFDSYGSVGTELTLFAVSRNARIKQIPVALGKRLGEPRFASTLRANAKIFRALGYFVVLLTGRRLLAWVRSK